MFEEGRTNVYDREQSERASLVMNDLKEETNETFGKSGDSQFVN